MKISVIVPIYNVEKKLKRTIESLIGQTYQDIEIILVNDGSTDQSQVTIEKYVKKYPEKIKDFYKENGGLSDARNYGVSKATGDYICFVDAGDYLDQKVFEQLASYMDQKIDLIKYKMMKVDEKGKILSLEDGPVFDKCSGEEAFIRLYATDHFLEVACIYLYRRKFWQEHQFAYTKNTYHEDFGLTPLVMVLAKTVVSTNEYGYYYVQDENSITRDHNYNKTVKQAQDLLVHYDLAKETIQNKKIERRIKEAFLSYYTNAILLKTKTLEKPEQNQYIEEIKKRKLYQNIKIKTMKQLLKKIMLEINIKWYLKLK